MSQLYIAYNVPVAFNHNDNKIQASHHKLGSCTHPAPPSAASSFPSLFFSLCCLSHTPAPKDTKPNRLLPQGPHTCVPSA